MQQTQPKNTPHKILLGLTGGIAAYKAAELVRLLVKANVDVTVVMTEAACQFITPVTMQAYLASLFTQKCGIQASPMVCRILN